MATGDDSEIPLHDIKECKREGRRMSLHEAVEKEDITAIKNILRTKNSGECDIADEEGWTPLHHAAKNGNVEIVKSLLCKGASLKNKVAYKKDENNKQWIEYTPVHIAVEEGHSEVLRVMVEKNSDCVDFVGSNGMTPLHVAAQFGHFNDVEFLLTNEARLDAKSEKMPDTPVHVAARWGQSKVLKKMIENDKRCVNFRGRNDEAPLHRAAYFNHLEAAEMLFTGSDIDINQAGVRHGTSPLHAAAVNGSLEVVKFLVEKGANVDQHKKRRDDGSLKDNIRKPIITPFYKAVQFGFIEVALFLLEKGAKVSQNYFKYIISEGHKELAMAVIEGKWWATALRGRYEHNGKSTTVFRELIEKMPDVAKMALDRCVLVKDKKKNVASDIAEYQVLYNYEFIEDYEDVTEQQNNASDSSQAEDGNTVIADEKDVEPKNYAFDDIVGAESPPFWARLKSFKRINHPLAIMIDHKRLDLLQHPVVSSLIHYKWFKFGLNFYIINLLAYIVYLALLTAFAIHVPNPQSPQCGNNLSELNSSINTENCRTTYTFVIGLSSLVLLLALGRFLFELVQIIAQKISYLKDGINWLEIAQYICTIIFVAMYGNDCYCVLNWQWQIGIIAVFLGWIIMILFIIKIPYVGIYVIILYRICVTFLRFVALIFLLVVAFGLAFYMTFFDVSVLRSPFSTVPLSLLKVMTMTTGELDFDALFRQDPAGENDDLSEIKYPPISYILWIVFLVLMPVILNNMLISLAVDVTGDVQDEAQLQKLALQVDQVLSVQQGLMVFRFCLPKNWKFMTHYRLFTIRKGYNYKKDQNTSIRTVLQEKWESLKFKLWGGVRYDQSAIVKNFHLHPQKHSHGEVLDKIEYLGKKIEGVETKLEHKFKDMTDEIENTLQSIKAMIITRDLVRKDDPLLEPSSGFSKPGQSSVD